MSLVNVSNVSHTYWDANILSEISLAIEDNSKIGLVGKNGCGKSTLFKIIAGKLTPSEGNIHIAKGKKIGYLTQDLELDETKTLFATVFEARPDLIDLFQNLFELEKQLEAKACTENLEKLNNLQNQITANDGYNFEHLVERVLINLNFTKNTWNKKINEFSGGEKTRIQLAHALLANNDILLLDEPTNHLDFDMIFWLENFLLTSGKPYIVISHDREFLNKVTTKTFEIKNTKLIVYGGNYDFYKAESKLRHEQQLEQFKRQQKFIEKTKDFIQKNMAGQKVSQAKSRLKMLNKLDVIEKPDFDKKLKLNINTENRSGNDVLVLKDFAFDYYGKNLANNVNLQAFYQDKIAIVGKNGCGKSSFFKQLLEKRTPKNGICKLGVGLKIAYYDQHQIDLDESLTVLQTIWNLMLGEPIGKPLSYLGKFAFSGDICESIVSTLSGGERARLFLAKLIYENPNFLLLDEPTNHLDIDTLSALEEALKNYSGTVLFISHDRSFIKNVANKIWYFANQTIIETTKTLQELFAEKKEKKQNSKVQQKPGKKPKINQFKLDKVSQKIEELNLKNEELENEIEQMHLSLADSKTYSNPELVKNINDKIKINQQTIAENLLKIDELEEEYLLMLEV